ncbi:MAG: hypothetical protein R2764_12785 [Bacteroidales bacterium]
MAKVHLIGLIYLVSIFQLSCGVKAQIISIDPIESFRIMFYNTENLFDIYNDSLTNDDEFTPDGDRHWNNKRFYKKINNTYKVIVGAGEWEPLQ